MKSILKLIKPTNKKVDKPKLVKKPNSEFSIMRKFEKNMTGNEQFSGNISSPQFAVINVNEECFFRCQMCDMWKRKDEYTPSLQNWKRFVTRFRKTVKLPFKISFPFSYS